WGRSGHTATLLPDGRVLIAGGYARFNLYSMLTSAELYDPSTGTFTATADMVAATPCPTPPLLFIGKLLIAGALSGPRPYCAQVYDPVTGGFTATGSYSSSNLTPGWPNTYDCSTATLLPNGKVLITRSDPDPNGTELYDPSNGTFASAGVTISPE